MFFEPSQDSQQTDTEDCTPDPRVIAVLDELDIRYEYTPGSQQFEAKYWLDGCRSQTVYIASRTHWFMGVELRQIFSAALASDSPFNSSTANLLLRENFDLIHGSWSILHEPEDKEHFAIFNLTAFASLHAVQLLPIIECVAKTADEMEHRLSGLDEF